jgi:hypothetical protein
MTEENIHVEKKFSDLTTEEINGMSEEQARPFATSQGWKSPEEFAGDPSKAKSAKDYLGDTFNEMPVLRQNLKKLADKNDELIKTVSQQSKHFTDFTTKQKERHKVDLQKAIDKAEKKMTKAEADFDVETVKEKQAEVIEFKNELKDIEVQEKVEKETPAKFEQQEAERKVQEWQGWLVTDEAIKLQQTDPIKFMGFQQTVGNIYNTNKYLPTAEIIKQAKNIAYPNNQSYTVQNGTANTKTNNKGSIPAEDMATVKRYIDADVKRRERKGATAQEIKDYRKTRMAEFEAVYKED